MAAMHETYDALAGKPLRIAASAASGGRPDHGRRRHDGMHDYADLCSSVLQVARSLAVAGTYGPALVRLLARASDLLEDIDEFLVALNPLRDGEAYLRAAELHRSLEAIQTRLPRPMRTRRLPAE
jgi:hypothetical protein